jgi:hypothetical protein
VPFFSAVGAETERTAALPFGFSCGVTRGVGRSRGVVARITGGFVVRLRFARYGVRGRWFELRVLLLFLFALKLALIDTDDLVN